MITRARTQDFWQRLPLAVLAGIPLLVFMLLAMRELMLPGIQLDEVNPDYLVVKMLDSTKVGTTPSWQLRDNILSPDYRWPVLAQYYVGVLPVYLSIPFYAALGFNVASLRILHALYGIVILALAFAVVYRITKSRPAALTGTLLLAMDAGFLLTFRTQFQLVLIPLSFVLGTILLILPRQAGAAGPRLPDEKASRPARFFWTGVSFGLGCYGYFVFGFFLPALLVCLLIKRPALGIPHWTAFVIGVAVGYSPWIFGMASMWRYHWMENRSFLATLADVANFVGPGESVGWAEKVSRTLGLLAEAVSNTSQPQMVTGTPGATVLGDVKLFVTAVASLAACLGTWAWGTHSERRGALMVVLFVVSFVLVAPFFGPRITVHHLNVVVPLVYLLISVSLATWMRRVGVAWSRMSKAEPEGRDRNPAAVTLAGALVALFMTISVCQQASLFRELRRTGGAGAFSEMRVLLAYDLLANYRDAVAFFPDWGFFAQVVYLSRGDAKVDPYQIPEPARLRQVLCSGHNALIIVDGGKRRSVADEAAAKAGLSVTTWRTFYQRDGTVNFEMALISSRQALPTCGVRSDVTG